MRVHVIGLGSAHGDDRAGLLVAERLQARPWPPEVRVFACPRPASQLLSQLKGAQAVVLVDASRTGRPPGTVHAPDPRQARLGAAPASSHGLSVARLLALAEALGRLPSHVECVAIEAGAASLGEPGTAVRAAVGPASERAEARARALAGAAGCLGPGQGAGPPPPGSRASG